MRSRVTLTEDGGGGKTSKTLSSSGTTHDLGPDDEGTGGGVRGEVIDS